MLSLGLVSNKTNTHFWAFIFLFGLMFYMPTQTGSCKLQITKLTNILFYLLFFLLFFVFFVQKKKTVLCAFFCLCLHLCLLYKNNKIIKMHAKPTHQKTHKIPTCNRYKHTPNRLYHKMKLWPHFLVCKQLCANKHSVGMHILTESNTSKHFCCN